MKRWLAVMALFLLALPAQAHFIWLLPPKDRDGTTAQMVFSDSLAPDAKVPIGNIKQTKLFSQVGNASKAPVKMKEDKGHFQIIPEINGEGMVLVGGVCEYGVIQKAKSEPFLLMYYPKAIWFTGKTREDSAWSYEGDKEMRLEIVGVPKQKALKVLWEGKPAANLEVDLIVPGYDEKVELKTDENGQVDVAKYPPKVSGYAGMLAKKIENKAGKFKDKSYKAIHHYATLTVYLQGRTASPKEQEVTLVVGDQRKDPAPDPAATKLFAEARAARAAWNNFPGFTADLTVNKNGKSCKGTVVVSDKGKVSIELPDEELLALAKREIGSLVSHRLPSSTAPETPCAFADQLADHPLGRTIVVLGDEMHSSYRIKDRQIIEVNRHMKDSRFTITVLENSWTKEKTYLPTSYVVSSWDNTSKSLKSTSAHHQTWTRIGAFDLPSTSLTVNSTPAGQQTHMLTFSNITLSSR